MTALDKARVTIPRTRVSHWGREANTRRSGQGNDTTHWRMGTRGSTWLTKWAALSARAPASLYLLHLTAMDGGNAKGL